ncbi:MAG: TetR/AcrR family transcriptional regulator [Clostridia bacterium]|nr:TetR/AcrR family transcriptional regulator [Clostridia bacterium]
MAQYKKEDIKEKIDTAALKIFAEKGYENAKISEIAGKAKVSVGNVYRYYKSKDEIFYSVVPETLLGNLKAILIEKITLARADQTKGNAKTKRVGLINEEFIEFMVSHKECILILFLGSKGTKYENIKNEIVEYLIHTVRQNYSGEGNPIIHDTQNHGTIRMIYEKLIEMMMTAVKSAETLEDAKKSLQIINDYHSFGVIELFK